jgi:hypothetical protein
VSYIDKNSTVVISARLTDKGRQLLSTGLLTFDTFRLGDSEIDYSTLGSGYDITLNNDLRAKSCNPKVKTPLYPTSTSVSPDVAIPTLTPVILQTVVQAPELGFFYSGGTGYSATFSAKTSTEYMYQADTIIQLSSLTGSSLTIPVNQATTYSANTYEPTTGDFMLVKMSNDELTTTLDQSVVENVPYLWYKVQGTSGTLSADTLQVTLDREFSYFPGYAGGNYCWAYFFPSGNPFTDGGLYSGGSVWNMNNVWSDNMAGLFLGTYEGFESYGSENYIGSKEYYGYTTEIQETESGTTSYCEWINSIGIIHFTNVQDCDNQTENIIGQKFYIDVDSNTYPSLEMPTLMWHREFGSGTTIGHTFTGTGDTKYVTLGGVNTDIRYFDLADEYGNSVGRIFPDLHTFTIDNQELVAAMSYKSNRNWTLPTLQWETSSNTDGVIDGTQNLYVTYMFASNTGYTTGLHCQNIVCANFELEDCPPTLEKAIEVSFPAGQFPFMTTSGGTGWYADRFYVLAQRTTLGTNPSPDGWVLMDYTSSIDSHTVGDRIDPINIENTIFTITNSDYITGTTYNLHDWINIPTSLETDLLQFGDESLFYGNVRTKGVTTKYRTKFDFTISPVQFNTSINPTYDGSGQNVHISEVGIYSGSELVAIGKMNLPIEKTPGTTVIIEMAFDL